MENIPIVQRDVLVGLIKKYVDKITLEIAKESGVFIGPKIEGIEIGTQRGLTLYYLLENVANLRRMIAIDPAPLWDEFNENIKNYRDRIQIIQLTSDRATPIWKPEEFDFVWIDGDHSYEQVKRDIQNYLPFVKKGGFIGGHDFGPTACGCGVIMAVNEIFGNKNIELGEDYTWWKYV